MPDIKWNQKTYEEFLSDPDLLKLEREAAVIRTAQFILTEVLNDEDCLLSMTQKGFMLDRLVKYSKDLSYLQQAKHRQEQGTKIVVDINVNILQRIVNALLPFIPLDQRGMALTRCKELGGSLSAARSLAPSSVEEGMDLILAPEEYVVKRQVYVALPEELSIYNQDLVEKIPERLEDYLVAVAESAIETKETEFEW